MAEVTKKIFQDNDRKESLVPMSKSQKIIISEIERAVVNDPILKDCGMDLSGDPYKIYTTCSMFLRACMLFLDSSNGQDVDIGGLLESKRDFRESSQAEKTGNLVAVIKPGYVLKGIAENKDVEMAILEVNVPDLGIINVPVKMGFDEKDRLILSRIQTQAAKLLAGYKYGLNPDDWVIYLISMLMIKHAALVAMMHARQSEEGIAVVNFADVIEMTVRYSEESNVFKIKCQPGKESKLIVKSDKVTEK